MLEELSNYCKHNFNAIAALFPEGVWIVCENNVCTFNLCGKLCLTSLTTFIIIIFFQQPWKLTYYLWEEYWHFPCICFNRQTGQSAEILSWNKLATCRTSWIVWSTMYHVYSFKDYSKSCNTWEFDILWIKGYIYGFTSI